MKKIFTLLAVALLSWHTVAAQLPNGTLAPDFTSTDIYGNTYHLYDLLDEGKTVYLHFMTAWCFNCWEYYSSGAFSTVWNTYGPPGTDEAFLFLIEIDPSTGLDCLYGLPSCPASEGDYVTGTPYPILDDASLGDLYAVSSVSIVYCICPNDKKAQQCGKLNASGLWSFRQSYCFSPPLSAAVVSVQNVRCYGANTGQVDISISGGAGPYTYTWSNGDHSQDLSGAPAGTYSCTITSSNGEEIVLEVDVEGPVTPLNALVVETTPVGCNGVLGSITVQGVGGWDDNYTYTWANGQQGPTAVNLSPGNHLVTVTDANLCTKTLIANLGPPVYPTAAAAQPGTITCAQPTIQLNGTASSQGDDFAYEWTASGGGNIVSGATTLTPTVNAAGNYTLQVTNVATTCAAYAPVSVTANTTQPSANAGPAMTISCVQPSAVLQGSGSSGSGISYLWTASNGGNIVSGAGTLTPTVNAAGTYTLQVANAANGCTKTASTTVSGNSTPPAVSANGGLLTCAVNNVTLAGNTNAQNPAFAWTGPNGYTSTAQNPAVNAAGTYNLVVTDPANGCTNTATATVAANTVAPGAAATGGVLTCAVTTLTLTGNSNAQNPVFAWTGPSGFSSALQNPATNIPGDYFLITTDPANGCTSSATATAGLNNAAPVASAAAPGNLNCNVSQLQLNGTGSSQGAGFNYSWTTANGNIVSGENTMTPLVNAPGVYNLLVINTDNGCTAIASASVSQSPAVAAAISAQTNVGCFGGADGTATMVASGGNGAFNYVWSNGITTPANANLPAGAYAVTATDGENCTSVAAVLIAQPDPLAANASATAQTTNGVNDASAAANPSGGTAAFSYLWSNGATTQTINGLAPGNYTVTVTDANNCTAVQTVTANSFNCALTATIDGANISCPGASNGSATVALTGAAEPVSYTWSNGANTASVSGLAPGNYTVSVSDANNCPASLNILISEPPQLSANASASAETAAGANDGSAMAAPAGGTAGYAYTWSTGATTAGISGLAPGPYTVSVADVNNCTVAQTVTVNAFNCTVSIQIAGVNVSCTGLTNGTATAAPEGGAAPYNYVWSNNQTMATITNLAAGTFTVSVTDDNACLSVQSITVTEPQPLLLDVVATTNVLCPGDASGNAEVSASGGVADYAYAWSTGAAGASISGLTAGFYSVTVTDANACTQNALLNITALDNVAPTLTVQNLTSPLDADGTVEISPQLLIAGMNDDCGVAQVEIAPSEFDCDQLGAHEVTVTVFDLAGNSASAIAIVTVVDNLPPSLTCPSSSTHCASDNIVAYTAPVAVDNCLNNNGGEWALLSGLPSGAEFPAGVTTQTYAYTDPSGNTGSCSFDVIITPPVNMTASVLGDVNGQGVGAIDLNVTGGTPPYTFKWSKDGQGFSDTEDLENLNAGVYTVEITDANGCAYQPAAIEVGNITVSTFEPAWLQGVQLRPNPTDGITRIVFAVMPDKALEIILTDVTGRTVLTVNSEQQATVEFDCSTLPPGPYFIQFRTDQTVGVRKLVVSR